MDFLYVSIKYGETVASGAGQSPVVTLLLDHGADVHARTRVGDCRTALIYMIIHITYVCMYVGYLKTSFHTLFMSLSPSMVVLGT